MAEKEKRRGRERKQKERKTKNRRRGLLLSTDSLPTSLEQLRIGQAEGRSWELN